MKLRGLTPPNLKGLKKSPEACRKISESRKKLFKEQGFLNTIETRKKIGEAQIGKKVADSTRAKMAASHKGDKAYNWKGGYEHKLWLNRQRRAVRASAEGIHTKQEWEELKRSFNYICVCCKLQEPFVLLTEDHILPLSRGGTNHIWNIQPLCVSCNSLKYTKCINYKELWSTTI